MREQPAALADGLSLSWDELRPLLCEAAGAQVLQEALLDKVLARECQNHGIAITPAEIESERRMLAESIARDAKAGPTESERLLAAVRASRGLGEQRFTRLLERNARMRRLVAPTVEVLPSDVAQAFEILHGVKYTCRVLMTAGQSEAGEARRELAASAEFLSLRFGEQALKRSIDPSASRGGLLDPLSAADPAYPAAVRNALATMKPGEMTPVLAVDRGFAIVLLESITPADGARLPVESPAIESQIRGRRERQAMDALAQRLVREAHLKVLDPTLQWSLEAARSRP